MKIYDAIMGLVVGDALGVPYEFKLRDTFKAEGMAGYGTHNQPPGTWSDDSSMTLATLSSIACYGTVKPDDIMHRFDRWLQEAAYTAHDEVFDIGYTTHSAILRYLNGTPPKDCGWDTEGSNGNGALMRILPLAFTPYNLDNVRAVAGLTHAHAISQFACETYIDIANDLLHGIDKETAIFCNATANLLIETEAEGGGVAQHFKRLLHLDTLSRDEIKSSGYVVDTLEAALWCLLKTDSYRDCVLTAVNLGDDTDTVAAVSGGLAGILYGVGGEKGIPEEWIEQIAKHDEIMQLCELFAKNLQTEELA